MLIYGIICIALALVGTTGLQFFYLTYIQRMNRELKIRVNELERHCLSLSNRLAEMEYQMIEQNAYFEQSLDEDDFVEEDDEVWAEIIEDERAR